VKMNVFCTKNHINFCKIFENLFDKMTIMLYNILELALVDSIMQRGENNVIPEIFR
jgi:hypothetical protein